MTIKVGTNISALQSQRRLGQATDKIGDVYQRLSTGQRINRAADDAAGLAIAEALNSNQRVFGQGVRNLNDGISAMSIADSAVEALTQITTRIYELAEQGANGTYSVSQRAALDKEAQVLRAEFLRIVQSTSFNGRNLLDGSVQGLGIQAGYGTDGSISASVGGTKGTGILGAATSFGSGFIASKATADFNGDGRMDLVGFGASNTVAALLGNGDGTFTAGASAAVGDADMSISTADFNGDGRMDIAVANYNDSDVSILLGNGDGSFGSRVDVAVGSAPISVSTADFNGDGRMDFVTSNLLGFGLSVALGNGDGTFRAASTVGGLFLSQEVVTGDLNGDGATDIVVANSGADNVAVFMGSGSGTFSLGGTYNGASSEAALSLADFNGDSRLDLVVANNGSSVLSVFLGSGSGSFGAAVQYSIGNAPTPVSTGDFNGDGAADIVAAGSSSDTISILLGNGLGGFGSATNLAVGDMPSSVAIGDFNGDGVADVVAGNSVSNNSSILITQTESGVQPLLSFSLKTQADSRQALSIVSRKLELLAEQRGVIGAAQSRLAAATQVLSAQREGYITAHSRIRDADIAGESSELARIKIIQQSATAVMAQANQQPALALQLLRL